MILIKIGIYTLEPSPRSCCGQVTALPGLEVRADFGHGPLEPEGVWAGPLILSGSLYEASRYFGAYVVTLILETPRSLKLIQTTKAPKAWILH